MNYSEYKMKQRVLWNIPETIRPLEYLKLHADKWVSIRDISSNCCMNTRAVSALLRGENVEKSFTYGERPVVLYRFNRSITYDT